MCRICDEQCNVLLGHTKATTTGIYGNVPRGVLSQRVEMMEAVAFSGLETPPGAGYEQWILRVGAIWIRGSGGWACW